MENGQKRGDRVIGHYNFVASPEIVPFRTNKDISHSFYKESTQIVLKSVVVIRYFLSQSYVKVSIDSADVHNATSRMQSVSTYLPRILIVGTTMRILEKEDVSESSIR